MSMLAPLIREEIERSGSISFARFMELALYCPNIGYYEQTPRHIGMEGDFLTSVSIGDLFGHLLAFQFSEWLGDIQTDTPVIIEAGANDGTLAADILGWFQKYHSELSDRLEYIFVESSERRRQWQRETLQGQQQRVEWVRSWDELLARSIDGIVFSNELIDAFPTHRIRWDAEKRDWQELGVTISDGHFIWRDMAPSAGARAGIALLRDLPEQLLEVLPDGFVTEVCPAATRWWRDAASRLRCGRLLTIDYGLSTEEFFTPARRDGTLRAYKGHRNTDDVLAGPGGQDLTASVNFSHLQFAGECEGLETIGRTTQEQFLSRLAIQAQKPLAHAFPEWTPKRLRQLQSLVHPEHFGRAFSVFVQRRVAQ